MTDDKSKSDEPTQQELAQRLAEIARRKEQAPQESHAQRVKRLAKGRFAGKGPAR